MYKKIHISHYLSIILNDTTLKSNEPMVIYLLNLYGGIMYEKN